MKVKLVWFSFHVGGCEIEMFRSLLLEAQFHGSKRLAERKYGIYWFVAMSLFLCGALLIILSTISRFFDNPSYITIQDTDSNKIRFPGVLICPEVDFPDYKMDDLVSRLNFPPDVNATEFRAVLRQLAAYYSPDVVYTIPQLGMLEKVLRYNSLEVFEVTKNLTASCEETVLRCRWLGINMDCSTLFRLEMTHYAFCCVFNVRSLKREIQMYGVHKAKEPEKMYVENTGPTSGLMVAINISQETINVDLSYKWVALQKGQTYAEVGINGTAVSRNTEYWFRLLSKSIVAAEATQKMSQHLRNCEMSTTKLKYFPSYSKANCGVECEMALMYKKCKCMGITHPRPPKVPYCKSRMLSCMRKMAVTYDAAKCHCPITCDKEIEETKTEAIPLIRHSYYHDPFYDNLYFDNVSIIRVFISRRHSVRFTRNAYYTSTDLFAQLGGVFNVYFGCSILTLLELVQLAFYYFRDQWSIRQHKKKLKSFIKQHPKTKKKNKKKVKFLNNIG